MVVVPALAVAEQANEDVVAAGIRGLVISIAPKVGYGVDRPGYVPDENRPNKHAPDENAEPELKRPEPVPVKKEFD